MAAQEINLTPILDSQAALRQRYNEDLELTSRNYYGWDNNTEGNTILDLATQMYDRLMEEQLNSQPLNQNALRELRDEGVGTSAYFSGREMRSKVTNNTKELDLYARPVSKYLMTLQDSEGYPLLQDTQVIAPDEILPSDAGGFFVHFFALMNDAINAISEVKGEQNPLGSKKMCSELQRYIISPNEPNFFDGNSVKFISLITLRESARRFYGRMHGTEVFIGFNAQRRPNNIPPQSRIKQFWENRIKPLAYSAGYAHALEGVSMKLATMMYGEQANQVISLIDAVINVDADLALRQFQPERYLNEIRTPILAELYKQVGNPDAGNLKSAYDLVEKKILERGLIFPRQALVVKQAFPSESDP